MTETIKILGLQELRETLLRDIPAAMQGKALQQALTVAARPIVAEARRRVPVKTGLLRRAIYSFRDRASTAARQARLISVRGGKKASKLGKDGFYWKFIEFGHLTRASKDSVGPPKHVPAKPFMRPAFEAKKLEAIELFRTTLGPSIAKVAEKARAKSRAKLASSIKSAIFG